MNGHCDLCGKASDRLDGVEDLWGLGVSTMCADPAECAETWAPGFATDPNDTAVLDYRPETWRAALDPVEPEPVTETRRLARPL